jgi:hypothetical protein
VEEEFIIYVRPLKDVITEYFQDPALLERMNLYPAQYYLVDEDGNETTLYSDLEAGSDWWDAQV